MQEILHHYGTLMFFTTFQVTISGSYPDSLRNYAEMPHSNTLSTIHKLRNDKEYLITVKTYHSSFREKCSSIHNSLNTYRTGQQK
jgi:hypothetical protein